MKKLPYDDFLKSMTLFFINEEIDKKYEKLRIEKVCQLRSQMSQIDSYAGLKSYIMKYEDSLSNLLVILGISNELFKRVQRNSWNLLSCTLIIMLEPKQILTDAEELMESAVMYLDDALARIRAGKASARILDVVRVEYYVSCRLCP